MYIWGIVLIIHLLWTWPLFRLHFSLTYTRFFVVVNLGHIFLLLFKQFYLCYCPKFAWNIQKEQKNERKKERKKEREEEGNREREDKIKDNMISWEPEGRYHYSTMLHWEQEGRYRCTKIYGDRALLVLNGTSSNSVNALLALSQQQSKGRGRIRESGWQCTSRDILPRLP